MGMKESSCSNTKSRDMYDANEAESQSRVFASSTASA